ncbi:hypothetical protein D9615_006600 [Tricholomella constricta]|uniref:Uncharacterized protein n=1 Tax=Tricholomella constricta TaxID=117010 RepID=A0A8H5M3J0_9AGAR|nr:hypothetical protein D9615_006600 [Tricholomella constricta]
MEGEEIASFLAFHTEPVSVSHFHRHITFGFLDSRGESNMFIFCFTSDYKFKYSPQICARYESLEPLGTAILTTIAELFMTLRVYALLKRNKAVLFVAGVIILWQWALIMYVIVQASKGTTHLAFLLSRDVAPALPTLPTTDPYHVCIFIVSPALVPWAEAFLCLCLSFDGLAFIGIIFGIAVRRREMNTQSLAPVTTIIRRDGVLYFFVLFSSNLVFLLVARYARPGLKNIHNQPAMVISAIMVNRITLNLKRESYKQLVLTWGTKTFLPVSALHSKGKLSQDIEMEPRTFREAEGTPRSFEHD